MPSCRRLPGRAHQLPDADRSLPEERRESRGPVASCETYGDVKRYNLAVQAMTTLAERGSNAYDAWFVAAEIYDKRLKNPAQARSAYSRVPSTSPSYTEAQKRLARS